MVILVDEVWRGGPRLYNVPQLMKDMGCGILEKCKSCHRIVERSQWLRLSLRTVYSMSNLEDHQAHLVT